LVYEDNIKNPESCGVMGSQQDRERIMAGFNLIKTQYTDV
jgi:hypothetical protein